MSASGPRSHCARVHPRPYQGFKPWLRTSAPSDLVLATQKLDGMTGRGTGLTSGVPIRKASMYDALTGRFTFPCPARGEVRVALSAFRQLESLPGAAHPAVFQVLFACSCGEEHEGPVTHDDLVWAPLGLQGWVFYHVMTTPLAR